MNGLGLFAGVIAGLSALNLYRRSEDTDEAQWLALAVLAAGTMLHYSALV